MLDRVHNALLTSDQVFDMTTFMHLDEKIRDLYDENDSSHTKQEFQRNNEETIRIPKIEVPVFDGSILKWQTFRTLFNQMVGSKKNLTGTQKMVYLIKCVQGEAASIISNLQIDDENYTRAWALLEQRYSSDHKIFTQLLDRMLNAEPIKPGASKSIEKLINTVNQSVSGFENLGFEMDPFQAATLHHILSDKLDKRTLSFYESKIEDKTTVRDVRILLAYLNKELHNQEVMHRRIDSAPPKEQARSARQGFQQKPKYENSSSTVLMASAAASASNMCDCKDKQPLYKCPKFIALDSKGRYNKAKDLKKCVNCLKTGHSAKTCTSRKCGKCNKLHNTMLHFEKKVQTKTALLGSAVKNAGFKHVFLATVIIHITDKYGKEVKARALLDSGSQLNMVTEKFFRKTGLKTKDTKMTISGIGTSEIKATRTAILNINSMQSNFNTPMEVFIVNNITTCQPAQHVDIKDWKLPSSLVLADPAFNIPAAVDIVIGGELFYNLLSTGLKSIGDNLPKLQNTVFGWVVIGKLLGLEPNTAFVGISTESSLEHQLSEFWKIEEKSHLTKTMTEFEQICEREYAESTERDPKTGKFIVKLQFTREPSILGKSEDMAIRRFYQLENKFRRDPDMKKEYVDFMNEYKDLGHMKQIKRSELGDKFYVIPHHAVRNPTSSTTKFRVVFDASAKTTTDYSLNNILANGPVLQDDLFSIMVRFRKHRYVFSADITKMYRQVLVQPEDHKWQTIVWRDNQEEELQYYKLKTVTYGTTCASYLAIKSLQQLAEEHETDYPLAAEIAMRDFNVDDVMTGSDDILELTKAQDELTTMLKKGNFHLHKWCSNHSMLLENIPKKKQEVSLDINSEKTETKALGMKWIPKTDMFMLHYTPKEHEKITKRTVLSETAQLFDPLGLVNPVIVLAKIFLQELWALKLDWDAPLPLDLQAKWTDYRNQLTQLSKVAVPRHISTESPVNVQLHVFSDASIKAYGACMYLRTQKENGDVTVQLICSKSRVAPVSATTLPRLELCAAVVMTELAEKVKQALGMHINKIVYWTDSELVLSWIYHEAAFKTFVANRIAAIKRKTNVDDWKYVPTKSNPADIISRGVLPDKLLESKLWWHGPDFLQQDEQHWPQNKPAFAREPAEEKKITTVLTAMAKEEEPNIIDQIKHRNSINTLQRVVAYCQRITAKGNKEKPTFTSLHLTPEELDNAMLTIIRHYQQEALAEDLQLLKNGEPEKTSFQSLTPFLDKDNVIRVGGRLQASSIAYEQKHPALLPKNHVITNMIMEKLHKDNMHAGAQELLAITRQKYWPISGKRTAQAIVKNCVLCNRSKPKLMEQLMGNLPADRVNISQPFHYSSLDFAGPIEVHYNLRGKKATKAYICIFVCFVTKAVHIEAAIDMTTEAFISCLRRFIARRGICSKIYCDNGTNFKGAHNQLADLAALMEDPQHQANVSRYCQDHHIQWNFMPPRSPHFGGLHESGVKSAKFHLKKILHSIHITYEELSTVLAEIEAILNSRPLTAMSNDPNDLQPLTAGHFLIGMPLNCINDSDLLETSKNKTWFKLAQIKHEFWNRWSKEYLMELQ